MFEFRTPDELAQVSTRWMTEVRIQLGKAISVRHHIEIGSGSTQPPIQSVPGALYAGEKCTA
jgi:hypothetical protein